MLRKLSALYAPEDGGDAGGGAAGGGSPQGGQDKQPKDGDVVPKTQFIAAINSANRKYETLETEVKELRAKLESKPAEAQKRYTRAELTAMVENRQITQEQADAQIDHQTREDSREEAARVAHQTVTQAQRKGHVDSEIARYTAVAPEILDDAHETRQRIKEEYQYLVKTLGDPDSVATQLKAIRAVLGPVEKLERSRNARPSFESHQDTGGGSGAPSGGKKDSSKPLSYDDLSAREKAHYDKLITRGIYKDKAAVNEELQFANANTRRKYGAMA
jgi:hypothetical protein